MLWPICLTGHWLGQILHSVHEVCSDDRRCFIRQLLHYPKQSLFLHNWNAEQLRSSGASVTSHGYNILHLLGLQSFQTNTSSASYAWVFLSHAVLCLAVSSELCEHQHSVQLCYAHCTGCIQYSFCHLHAALDVPCCTCCVDRIERASHIGRDFTAESICQKRYWWKYRLIRGPVRAKTGWHGCQKGRRAWKRDT